MPDYFALFDEPRHPWIDSHSLKAKFLLLSTNVHPDRFHTTSQTEKQMAHQRYLELTTAYNVLREPKDRLRHLLELELGAKPEDIQRIPDNLANVFIEVGQLCRDVDAFLAERLKTTSPLLKVQMFERAQAWTAKLTELQSKINLDLGELKAELHRLNDRWESAPAIGSPNRSSTLPLERLEEIYRLFSYLTRWANQIQERVVQLAF